MKMPAPISLPAKRAMALLVSLAFVTACSSATFGGKSSKGNKGKGNDQNDPNDQGDDKVEMGTDAQVNPTQPELDISDLDKNKDIKNNPSDPSNPGPTPGTGEVLSKVINLTCENSQGVDINVGTTTTTNPNTNTNNGGDNNTAEPNPFVTVDTDGNPVGGDNTANTGDPSGNEPLPYGPAIPTSENARVKTTVKGEFCPKATNTLTVLFVVDFSGSMGRHIPLDGGPEQGGNDPQISGSCGRMRAAQAIMDQIAKTRHPGDKIRVGMVPFAGGIVTNRVISITDDVSFAKLINKDSFCQYVVQDPSFGYDPGNPGAIDGDKVGKGLAGILGFGKVDSSTNYKAALNAATATLLPEYGRKVVYFISDGQPTSGASDPTAAGINAGKQMRTVLGNLELNGLYLGAPNAEAEKVLAEVTGSVDRVRRAENANDLAKQILTFPDGSIDPKSGAATLTVAPYPTENLGLQYLTKNAAKDMVWSYETQPFVLLGSPGKTVINRVEVTAKGADGSTYKAVVRIRYTQ